MKLEDRLTKEQVFRIVVGALKQTKKDHEEKFDFKNQTSFAKRLAGLIHGFIFNNDGVENGEIQKPGCMNTKLCLSSPFNSLNPTSVSGDKNG